MSRPAMDDLVAGAGLEGRPLVLVDYSAMARRLTLRIDVGGQAGPPQIRTLMFDSVIGLHCDPPSALEALVAVAQIHRLDARPRKSGEFEVALTYTLGASAGDAEAALSASFLALDARWLG
ncbi:MAG: hypothetical protein ACK5JM_08855 [Rhodoblastus sp.]